MAFITPRPPKIRALEKLQKILTRGARNGAKGYGQLFWKDGLAVLRNSYDLGASKPGSLMLHLGERNSIMSIKYDDAGPAWDCNDEHSEHWEAINRWATGTLNDFSREHVQPMAAESMYRSVWLGDTPNFSAKSHTLLREMAMAQWRENTALKAVVDQLLPDELSFEAWLHKAQYLSETLVLEKKAPENAFEYKGQPFNSNCMLPWLLLATFEEMAHETDQAPIEEMSSVVYTHARLQRKIERTETQYDWRVYTTPMTEFDLFSGPCHVRIAMGCKFGIFTNVRPHTGLGKLSAPEREQGIKNIYDIVNGHVARLAPEQAYALDCKRLSELRQKGSLARMPRDARTALRVIAEEWWAGHGTQGRALLDSVQSLYPWEQMATSNPSAALDLLADMAGLASPSFDVSIGADGPSLFESA